MSPETTGSPAGQAANPVTTATTVATTQTVQDLLANSVRDLAGLLTVRTQSPSSHTVAFVEGLEQPEAMDAFAAYALIAGIGQAIRINLAISTEMLGTGPAFGDELQREVERLIGSSNTITADFREDQRDPWFTECLGHALLNVSRTVPHLGPPSGQIEALTLIHTDVHDHGLDLVGLHIEQAVLGLSVAEAKASESNASNHGSATAILFAEIDAGKRDIEIRGKVQLLREALSTPNQALITPSFWRGERVYLAVISYGADSTFAPGRVRPAYASLAVASDRIRLIAIALSDFRRFFDGVADRVRTLVPVVAQLGRGSH